MSDRELRFRLPGRWFSVDLAGEDTTRASIKSIVRDVFGTRDDAATQRAEARRLLQEAVTAASTGDIRALMFSHQVAGTTPLPISLLLFEPANLRMSPAVGTGADAVLSVLTRSIKELDPAAHSSLVEVAGPGVPAVRTHRVEETADGGEYDGVPRLTAQYWIPVPGSKQVLSVSLTTPLGDLENLMLTLFDSFIGAAYFADDKEPSLRDQLLTGPRS